MKRLLLFGAMTHVSLVRFLQKAIAWSRGVLGVAFEERDKERAGAQTDLIM